MSAKKINHATTVGKIDSEILAFTVGRDREWDLNLIEADCLCSAAHATMLSRMPMRPKFFSPTELRKIIAGLTAIIQRARQQDFEITLEDQDVHLAIERTLTEKLGDLGKKIHTGRSRNDQVAVALRVFAKEQLLALMNEIAQLALACAYQAEKNQAVPMVGRTHMQPAMPSSAGLFFAAHAESLLDDAALVLNAYELNDMCPLGSAASYGVPLPIDPALTADLLGFGRPFPNALYAANARGKNESIILSALSQVMLTLSRAAQDLILFSMPEFGYFSLPAEFCTGSSIMPQKRNPDALELIRAKASRVQACAQSVFDIVKNSASGYNRDLQETKGDFMEGLSVTRASVRVLARIVAGLKVDEARCVAGFTPDVFATDVALQKVVEGMPFRDAYHYVKAHLDELQQLSPHAAVAAKQHLGGTAGIDFSALQNRIGELEDFATDERADWYQQLSKLLGKRYAPQA